MHKVSFHVFSYKKIQFDFIAIAAELVFDKLLEDMLKTVNALVYLIASLMVH